MEMTKPVLSPRFDVDDIQKLREYQYEITKNMTERERGAYYESQADEFLRSAGIVPKNVRAIERKQRRQLDFDSYVIPCERANFADSYIEGLRSNARE